MGEHGSRVKIRSCERTWEGAKSSFSSLGQRINVQQFERTWENMGVKIQCMGQPCERTREKKRSSDIQSQRACHWHIPISNIPYIPLHISLGRVLLCGWAFHLGIWVCGYLGMCQYYLEGKSPGLQHEGMVLAGWAVTISSMCALGPRTIRRSSPLGCNGVPCINVLMKGYLHGLSLQELKG